MTDGTAPALYVASCGAAKQTHPAPAWALYTGSARMVIDSCRAEADRDDAPFAILSALHGLLDPWQIVAPYEQRIDRPGAIAADAVAAQLRERQAHTVYSMCPKPYYRLLRAAAEIVNTQLDEDRVIVHDVFEAAPGIGYQRGVAAGLTRTAHLL